MFVSIIGWVGTALVLAAYSLNALGRVAPSSWLYPALNISGGAGLIVNAFVNGAWPLVALNGIWIVVGAVGLAGFIRARVTTPIT